MINDNYDIRQNKIRQIKMSRDVTNEDEEVDKGRDGETRGGQTEKKWKKDEINRDKKNLKEKRQDFSSQLR